MQRYLAAGRVGVAARRGLGARARLRRRAALGLELGDPLHIRRGLLRQLPVRAGLSRGGTRDAREPQPDQGAQGGVETLVGRVLLELVEDPRVDGQVHGVGRGVARGEERQVGLGALVAVVVPEGEVLLELPVGAVGAGPVAHGGVAGERRLHGGVEWVENVVHKIFRPFEGPVLVEKDDGIDGEERAPPVFKRGPPLIPSQPRVVCRQITVPGGFFRVFKDVAVHHRPLKRCEHPEEGVAPGVPVQTLPAPLLDVQVQEAGLDLVGLQALAPSCAVELHDVQRHLAVGVRHPLLVGAHEAAQLQQELRAIIALGPQQRAFELGELGKQRDGVLVAEPVGGGQVARNGPVVGVLGVVDRAGVGVVDQGSPLCLE